MVLLLFVPLQWRFIREANRWIANGVCWRQGRGRTVEERWNDPELLLPGRTALSCCHG